MAGTPDGSALGYPSPPPEDAGPDPLAEDVGGSEEEQTASRPWEREGEQTGEQGGEEQQPPPPQLFAGRYQSVEDLETGYKQVQAEYTRNQQQLAELRNQVAQLQPMGELVEKLVPYVQSQLAEEDPELAEQLKAAEALRPIIEEELKPLREQMVAQQSQAEVESIISAFRSRHPDVPPGTKEDFEVAQLMTELELNVMNADSLEIAYEAWRWPGLGQVLKANPSLIETDDGIAYARLQAQQFYGPAPGGGQPPAGGAPQPNTPAGATTPAPAAPSPAAPTARPSAFVETGGTGAPAQAAPGTRPRKDEFDEAYDAWASERKSPLFGGLVS